MPVHFRFPIARGFGELYVDRCARLPISGHEIVLFGTANLQKHVHGRSGDDHHGGEGCTEGSGRSVDTQTGEVGRSIRRSSKDRVGEASSSGWLGGSVVGVVPGQPDGGVGWGEGRRRHVHDLDVEGTTRRGDTREHGGVATSLDGLDNILRAAVSPDGVTSTVLTAWCTVVDSLNDSDTGLVTGDGRRRVVGEDLSGAVESETKVVVVQVPVTGVGIVLGVESSAERSTLGSKVISVEGDGCTGVDGVVRCSCERGKSENCRCKLHHCIVGDM